MVDNVSVLSFLLFPTRQKIVEKEKEDLNA
jgi:hypothetical protein